MPAYPRSHYLDEDEIETHHTWSRCVQRAFLCGKDPETEQNFDYRRVWIEQLFLYQARVFAVDLCNYDILSNHQHLIVRTRPDIPLTWSAEEVAWRWKMAWPHWDAENQTWIAQPDDEEIRQLMAEPNQVTELRKRLASLSWFMARVKEPIAKMANAEMQRTGHFWEGRFGSRRLEDLPSQLSCSVYVDLNQLRAGMAHSLEDSHFSAIRLRLLQWRDEQARLSLEEFHREERADLRWEFADMQRLLDGCFLAPISDQGPLLNVSDVLANPKLIVPAGSLNVPSLTAMHAEPISEHQAPELADASTAIEEQSQLVQTQQPTPSAMSLMIEEVASAPEKEEQVSRRSRRKNIRFSRDERSSRQPTYEIHRRQRARQRARASDHPFLGIPCAQYLELVTWTAARFLSPDEELPMPASVTGTLEQSGIVAEQWLKVVGGFETLFHAVVGAARNVTRFLESTQRRSAHGLSACRSAFT